MSGQWRARPVSPTGMWAMRNLSQVNSKDREVGSPDHPRSGAPEELCHDEVGNIRLVMGNLLL